MVGADAAIVPPSTRLLAAETVPLTPVVPLPHVAEIGPGDNEIPVRKGRER